MNAFRGKHGPLLIAEIGGNHEGDFEYAKELVNLAIESDVDYIKLQLYQGDSLVNPNISPDRNKHFKKFELSKSQYIDLAQMVIDAGKSFTSSVWDPEYLSWIDKYMDIYKIGSGDLTCYPILTKIAQKGKPIVLSTGLSMMNEVENSVAFLRSINSKYQSKDNLAVLQCTSMYPIENSDVHLNTMFTYKNKLDVTIGYSDHTTDLSALKYATAMRAEVLEFHFTDSRDNKTFRDHKVSLTKSEVLELIEEIKLIRTIQGSNEKQPLKIETDNNHVYTFRRAVYPKTDIPANTLISEEHLVTLRPNEGIGAEFFYELVGKYSAQDLKKYQKLDWNLFK
ncbi:MAG TPA: N-acetylneuraminate synthase [Cytophagales bacterium]|jgi:N,N'-diacetyllegionaminate synthase|nr:N-acetylneuraminate synthase [Cytophagales bacterium]